MKGNKWLWLWITIGTLVIFIVPLAMDWLIIGNDLPSNIDDADWVGFFGGYIGAIVGAIFSLIGIIITIRHTSSENRRDRELQIRPYCLVSKTNQAKLNPHYDVFPISFEYNPTEAEDYYRSEHIGFTTYLEFRNVGIGPILDFEAIQDKRIIFPPDRKATPHGWEIIRYSCLSPGESIYMRFSVIYMCKLPGTDQEWNENLVNAACLLQQNYCPCNIPYTISYTDMIGTRYTQRFSISIRFTPATDRLGHVIDGVNCVVGLQCDNVSVHQ